MMSSAGEQQQPVAAVEGAPLATEADVDQSLAKLSEMTKLSAKLSGHSSTEGSALDPILKWKETYKASPAPLAKVGEWRDQLGKGPARTFTAALVCKDWEGAKKLLTPEAARTKDIMGRLPLSAAIAVKAPEQMLASLIDAYPDAAKEKDTFGDLPLHVGLKIGLLKPSAEDVPIQVLAAYPAAAKVVDKMRELPLIYAIEHRASAELIGKLLDAHPAAAKEKSKRGHGYFPLQAALRAKASEEIVRRLLMAHPEATSERDVFGWIPLQIAMREYQLHNYYWPIYYELTIHC